MTYIYLGTQGLHCAGHSYKRMDETSRAKSTLLAEIAYHYAGHMRCVRKAR